MKKFFIYAILLVVVSFVLVATCPSKKAHCEAIQGVLSGAINKEMDQSRIDETMASIGTMLAVNAVNEYLNSSLIVRDHTLYNVGVVSYKGEFRMVSVGVLNHVFTISEDDARQFIKDQLPLSGK